jgi:hypothetical protein
MVRTTVDRGFPSFASVAATSVLERTNLAPAGYTIGEDCERACDDATRWLHPLADRVLELPAAAAIAGDAP